MVISANKWEQNQSEIPFEILSIDAKEMSFSSPQTAADMLEATGQVFVQKSQLGGGSPMIRGFGANSVLIVVDGVRMNNTIFRSGNLQNVINIDPNSLESSEVIFGPGAVIYGSDALGGVMDFHTVSPSFANNDQKWVEGHAMARYSSANNEKTATALINIGRNKFGYVGSFSISDFGDLQTGSVRPDKYPDFGKRPEYVQTISGKDTIVQSSNANLQKFSGFRQLSTLHKFAFRPNDNFEIGYNFNFSTTTDIPRYDRLIEYAGEELKYARWNYGPQKWMMNAIKVNFFKSNEIFDAVKKNGNWDLKNNSSSIFYSGNEDKYILKPELNNLLACKDSTKYMGDLIRILASYLGSDMENQYDYIKEDKKFSFQEHDKEFIKLVVNRGKQRGNVFIEKVSLKSLSSINISSFLANDSISPKSVK